MAVTASVMTEDQIFEINALATGLIAGFEKIAPLYSITESTFFKLSASTAIAGAVVEAVNDGQYTRAFAEGFTGWAAGQAATAIIAAGTAAGITVSAPVSAGVVTAATAVGIVLGKYLYTNDTVPSVDWVALANSIGQAVSATVATPNLSISNTTSVLEQNLLNAVQNSPNANLPSG